VEWILLLRNKGQTWDLAKTAVNLWSSIRKWGMGILSVFATISFATSLSVRVD